MVWTESGGEPAAKLKVGFLKAFAPMSNGTCDGFAGAVAWQLPGETEAGSAEEQPAKGYPGRRCAKGVSGPRRLLAAEGRFVSASLQPLDIGVMPYKTYRYLVTGIQSTIRLRNGNQTGARAGAGFQSELVLTIY